MERVEFRIHSHANKLGQSMTPIVCVCAAQIDDHNHFCRPHTQTQKAPTAAATY